MMSGGNQGTDGEGSFLPALFLNKEGVALPPPPFPFCILLLRPDP